MSATAWKVTYRANSPHTQREVVIITSDETPAEIQEVLDIMRGEAAGADAKTRYKAERIVLLGRGATVRAPDVVATRLDASGREVLDRALRVALSLGHNYIGLHHLQQAVIAKTLDAKP